MTDTNTLAPTDAEIFALEVAHTKRHETRDCTGYFSEFDIVAFTLSAIAKWGAPAPASQPFAYEFSRSNGDGTHSEHIERGRLQEVAPGRWEHSGLPRGALADKPIKALYTTPQTQPAAVLASGPVAWLHDCAALLTNDVELWIDACPHCGKPRNAPQPVERQPLTDEQIEAQPVAWALQWPADSRLNLSTVFDTQIEATDYLKRCSDGVVVVPLYAAPQPAVQAAPVDATVQEDAERWQFLAEYLVGPRTDLDDEIVGCDSVQKMARVLDATIAAQKETND